MSIQVRFKCVSAHKVVESGKTFYDARLLAASASEQPAGVFTDKPAGKLDLQRLSTQPFQQDQEYVITIDPAPAPASAAAPSTAAPSTAAPTTAAPSTAAPTAAPEAQTAQTKS
jgi:hypothetical protein